MSISGFLWKKIAFYRLFGILRAMVGTEREGGGQSHNVDPVNILALYESGRIREQEMSEEESRNLHLAKGIMLDDPIFEAKVRQRMLELEAESKARQVDPRIVERSNAIEITALINLGRIKTSDLSDENKNRIDALRKEAEENPELKARIINREKEITPVPNQEIKKKKAGAKKTKESKSSEKAAPVKIRKPKGMQLELVFDDNYDQKVMKVGKMLNGRLGGDKDKVLRKEVRIKKNELRKMIGLPVTRKGKAGKKDGFYVFLATRVVTWDIFSIFKDYVTAIGEPSEELKARIETVKNMVSVVASAESGLKQNQRYKYYHDTLDEYQEKWGSESL